ncbi:hypothetical protein GCM10025868_19910 [Angustibacter aerolatus]|uniref:Glycosyl hydrolase family 4 C-terminal domain-containing protein n=1 Tax=Angustibacter aerolatus TaxID=1162965 RepID=A0ABQ6JEV8_9ACTN|nr:hypothetical protein GCM10025868_19910 [Angustibacter aerolatus]
MPWYLHSDDEIERLRIPVGEYVRISEQNLATYARTRDALAAGEHLPLEREATEYAPLVVHAMVTGEPVTIVGNVLNEGLVTNLPPDVCVEVPCVVDADGVHPQPMGDLPAHLAAVNRAACSVGDLTIRAAMEDDPAMVRRAVMVDANTSATLTLPQIWSLCDDLVAAHGDLLPPALRVPSPPEPPFRTSARCAHLSPLRERGGAG